MSRADVRAAGFRAGLSKCWKVGMLDTRLHECAALLGAERPVPRVSVRTLAAGLTDGHGRGHSGCGPGRPCRARASCSRVAAGGGVLRRLKWRAERRPGWARSRQGQRRAAATPPKAQRSRRAATLPHSPGCMRGGRDRVRSGRAPPTWRPGAIPAAARFRIPKGWGRGQCRLELEGYCAGTGSARAGRTGTGSWDVSAPAGQAGAGAGPEGARAGRVSDRAERGGCVAGCGCIGR